MSNEIRVPTLGESVAEATVGQWLKKAGDAVSVDEPLVELETDKVSVEVPAPAAGVLADIAVAEGETVEVGALLGMIGEAGAATAAPAAATAAPAAAAAPDSAQSSPGKIIEIPVPSAGESVTEAEVGEWLKQVGDSVAVDEPLVELQVPERLRFVPTSVPFGPPQNVAQAYVRMAEAVQEGKPFSPSFEDALEVHRLLDAIQQSSDKGRVINLV